MRRRMWHRPSSVRSGDLRLDHLDLYLIHWPFRNTHAPGVDVGSRDPDARPYMHDAYMETWGELEKLVERGLVRHIGTSNMTIPKLRLVLRDARIRPAANEMELHPHFQQPDLFDFVQAERIDPDRLTRPIGSPARPERDRTPEDSVDIEDPVIVETARRLEVLRQSCASSGRSSAARRRSRSRPSAAIWLRTWRVLPASH